MLLGIATRPALADVSFTQWHLQARRALILIFSNEPSDISKRQIGANMIHKLPELPYPMDALEPHISRETLEYHYGKHHATYVETLNELIRDSEYADMTLEQIIYNSTGPVFNNAAQAWNHAFYWQCLQPPSNVGASSDLQQAIAGTFGSLDGMQEKFNEAAMANFGSGWTWLLVRDGWLEIESTDDADVPSRYDQRALLVCDVWEHAYYIDYRNERQKYLEGFWQVVNWRFAGQRFAQNRRAA